jgi:DNA-binding transcriptional MocR family regulator
VREVISRIEQQLAEPTAKGLAGAVSRAVREGTLTAGERLPPIRDLARELALSPTTVSSAWALLVRSGTIETAGRRGTRVADPRQPRDGRYRQALEHQTTFALDLSTGIPDAALLPSLDRAVRQLTTAGTPASYLDEPVLPDLHAVLAETWPYPAATLTVVDGAMDALELVIRTSLRYGDRVIVEHPTFPPLLDLLEAAGVEVAGVRLDDEGIVPQGLESALEQPAQALFLQPRAHNPTGTSMSPRRARALGRLLGRLPAAADLLVVEDDSANAISTSPDVTLGTLLPDRTVHVRSFSKSHGPDLRLAAMSGPEELVASVRHLRQLGQGWSSRLLQRLLVGLLTDERTQAEVVAAREEYARRRSRFVERLSEHGVSTVGTDGLNVWVPVHDEAAALMRLASLGIGVAPGAPFAVLPERAQHVRVTVGLVGERLEHVADEVARAARTGGRRAGAR